MKLIKKLRIKELVELVINQEKNINSSMQKNPPYITKKVSSNLLSIYVLIRVIIIRKKCSQEYIQAIKASHWLIKPK